jgi:hypothetical protein
MEVLGEFLKENPKVKMAFDGTVLAKLKEIKQE